MSQTTRPVVLCVFDGFGHRPDAPDNAVTLANTPNIDRYFATCPHALLDASEEHVGLPHGQMGNSEVGHMNLGAGQVIFQDLPMIDRVIKNDELKTTPALIDLIKKLQASKGTCHLMGLASPGGVHSHQDHLVALAKILNGNNVPVAIHAFLDGRDMPPQSANAQIGKLVKDIAGLQHVKLATLCGRYYAMDRDNRWERVEKAYRLLANAEGKKSTDAVAAIEQSYAEKVYDEFLLPVSLGDYAGMVNGDGILFINFRADRAREILHTLIDPSFSGFARPRSIQFAAVAGMVEYSDKLNKFMTALFPPKIIENTLGELVSKAGKKQLRIAETEKYPHVTFFFNGGREEPYPGEERILVPSPKVATYDLKPEMSAPEVTDKLVDAIHSGSFDMIVVNYANGDMVGHTGDLQAAIKAVEALDTAIGRVEAAVKKQGGVILLTADHGNCERMHDDETHGPHTAHTLNLVPVILINAPEGVKKIHDGKLADVAPTLLHFLNLPQPSTMTGKTILN